MQTPIPFYLEEILDAVRDNKDGDVADYIPELAHADPDKLGIAMCTTSGHVYAVGDADYEFTIQSISKPFVYALALQELGPDKVAETVGVEPSGEAFNEMSLGDDGRPVNPMINAGAIAVNQLINGAESSPEERVETIRKFLSRLAGRELTIDAEVNDSELQGADRNMSLAYMLRTYGIIEDAADDAVLTYTNQCSTLVTVKDLAVMSATLANGGRQPVTGEKILDADVCRLTMAVMSSAGMYNQAGRWMAQVGIPAKSGVAGGLIGTLPGLLGISTLSPRLNEEGNSVRGVEAFKLMSKDMGLHLMSTVERYGVNAVRSVRREGDDAVVRLQGYINFNAAESILHEVFAQYELEEKNILLDFSFVSGSSKIARRMLKEGLRRLREDGHHIAAIDPDGILSDRTLSDGTEVPLRDSSDVPAVASLVGDEKHKDAEQTSRDNQPDGEDYEINGQGV
ncbi:glutaminase [Corynebacterium endometrii]|uniref:Glutaminase n=1 Tax=Corynebacterium endometrii TaxID=2488819 RepID=A0A4P7QJT9_9CORY|nr:glutaminase [Corynebacterium endometrii]QCB29067.1 Glutaminase 1 [Corynebacterium endometrii]